jgi:hypothetical protein
MRMVMLGNGNLSVLCGSIADRWIFRPVVIIIYPQLCNSHCRFADMACMDLL